MRKYILAGEIDALAGVVRRAIECPCEPGYEMNLVLQNICTDIIQACQHLKDELQTESEE